MSIIRRIIKKVEDEEENDIKELTVLHPAVDYTPVPSIGYKPPTTYDYRSIRQYKQRTTDSDRDYKKIACNRERKRMDDMNKALDALRKILPRCKPPGKKLSKIETLRLAIRHICHLQSRLQGDKMYENNFLTNSDLEEQQYNAPSTSWAVPYYPSFGLGSPHSYYSYQLDPSQYPQYKTKLKLL